MRFIGIDPGGTTGYCILDKDPETKKIVIQDVGEVKSNSFYTWLDSWGTKGLQVVVCEDFIARPNLTDGRWTEMPVPEQKGAIAYRSHQLGCRFVVLQPSDKPMGYKAANLPYHPGKKGTHMQDASAHAFYAAKLGYTKSQRKF